MFYCILRIWYCIHISDDGSEIAFLISSKFIFVIPKYIRSHIDLFSYRYYRSFVFSCEKCSPCCEDTKEEDIEPQCLRQGFSSDRACRHTGRNCGRLQPTSTPTIKIVLETTATQGLKKSKLPSSYLIGGTVLIIAVLLLLLLTMFLVYRVYFDGRRKERTEMVRLKGKWLN